MLASVTMCNDDISNYNSKISDLGYPTPVTEQLTPVVHLHLVYLSAFPFMFFYRPILRYVYSW